MLYLSYNYGKVILYPLWAAINEISSELICQPALSPIFNVKWKAQFEIWWLARKLIEHKFGSI